jgi:hypothetical protein
MFLVALGSLMSTAHGKTAPVCRLMVGKTPSVLKQASGGNGNIRLCARLELGRLDP